MNPEKAPVWRLFHVRPAASGGRIFFLEDTPLHSFTSLLPRIAPVRAALALVAMLALCASPALAQSAREPARGSAERSAIMDAIRPLVEVRVGAPVEFVVDRLKVAGPWAFAIVNPQRPGGGAIDLATTTFAENAEYMDGLTTYVLLYQAYDRWNVVDQAIGPTDAFWYGDPLYERLPAGLVPN